jgi:hypothetical protein
MKRLGLVFLLACHSQNKSLADSGFAVARDGLAFANFARPADSDGDGTTDGIDTDAMVRMFGAANACVGGAVPCVLVPAAEIWMSRANQFLSRGRCDGFSILSQLLHSKTIDPATFGGSDGYSLANTQALQKELAYWQSTQLLAPNSEQNTLYLTGKDAVTLLQEALKPNSATLFRIGMVNVENGAQVGAHSVTPIGVEETTVKNQYWIRVYDSNLPGAEQHITVNTAANTWSYTAVNHAGGPSVVLSGDATAANPLYVWTSAPHLGTFECPFCATLPSGGQVYTVSGATITNADFGDSAVTFKPIFLTNFGALFCQNDCGGVPTASGTTPPNGLYVDVVQGSIMVTNASGSQSFQTGQFGYVANLNSPPVIVPPAQGVPVTMPLSISQNSGVVGMSSNGTTVKTGDVACIVQRDTASSACQNFLASTQPPVVTPTPTAPATTTVDNPIQVQNTVKNATNTGKVPKLFCSRRDTAAPTTSPGASFYLSSQLASGAQQAVVVTFPANMNMMGAQTLATAIGGVTATSGSISVCGDTDSPADVIVSATSSTGEVFQGVATLPTSGTIDADPSTWQGAGQPLTLTITSVDAAPTTIQIPDMQTPDVVPPTPGSAPVVAGVRYSQVKLTWGAAVDPDNTTTNPVPPLYYKVVYDTNAANLATTALVDASPNIAMAYTADVSSASLSLPPNASLSLAVIVKDLSGNEALYPLASVNTPGGKLIFVTAAPGNEVSGAVGISGADAACASDSNAPDFSTFKAMLVDGASRVACTSSDCSGGVAEHTDWVLTANTPYVNIAGGALATTDANGLFGNTFSSTIYVGTNDEPPAWTGLNLDWTTSSDNCAGWTSTSGSGEGGYPKFIIPTPPDTGNNTPAYAFSSNTFSCTGSFPVYCVEQ